MGAYRDFHRPVAVTSQLHFLRWVSQGFLVTQVFQFLVAPLPSQTLSIEGRVGGGIWS